MEQVQLADAVIVANVGLKGKAREVRVLPYLDRREAGYDIVVGACEARWHNHPDHRLGFLHEIIWSLALSHNFEPMMIHKALQSVSEYRELEFNSLT